MAYLAYEVGVGKALSATESYCRHATLAGRFGQQTIPNIIEVESFLTQGFYELQGKLAQNSLALDQSEAEDAALAILQEMNVLHACIAIEQSLPTEDWTGAFNNRVQLWISRRDQLYGMMVDGTLDALGVVEGDSSPRRQIIFTGIYKVDKTAIEQNDTLVPHQVRREQFKDPATIPPGWISGSIENA